MTASTAVWVFAHGWPVASEAMKGNQDSLRRKRVKSLVITFPQGPCDFNRIKAAVDEKPEKQTKKVIWSVITKRHNHC